ncbi:hypothetical protein NDU88_008040 [Pleurodeles waltl]|uniref:Uncharacterized protein n=1 Tax=Pleurodeles waltl TaxID=8319 RepID=A0AAV7VRE6_PLEWA|nr:hypothetical protein NDU88_008040 [Pleurodeles waltl]
MTWHAVPEKRHRNVALVVLTLGLPAESYPRGTLWGIAKLKVSSALDIRVTETANKGEEKPERERAGELEEETRTETEDERRTSGERSRKQQAEPSRRRTIARTRAKEEGNQTQREAWKKV